MNHLPRHLSATPRLLRRLWIVTLLSVGLTGLGVSSGCTSDPQVINQANQVHAQVQPAVVTDPELAGYVQAIGDRIVEVAYQMYRAGELEGADDWMFRDIQFHLVASPQLNAFTTGGTHAYLYTALLEQSRSEDEFAAVVAHEYGHIVGRHVQQAMDRQMGILAAAGAAGILAGAVTDERRMETGATVAGVTAAAGQFFGMGFGRENEREADAFGFDFYVRAGYDPDRFADFFKNMVDAGYDTTPQLLSSHPTLQSRVEAAERRAQRVSPEARERYRRDPIASGEQFRRLQQRSAEFTRQAQQMAETGPAAFQEAQAILASFPACVRGDDHGEAPRRDPPRPDER